MKKYILVIVILFIGFSCGSDLYQIRQLRLDDEHVMCNEYDLDDFEVYAYAICEDASKEYNNERFFNCPPDFFSRNRKDTLKVEEVYLLKRKSSNLVLYITTYSHKYIREATGFLNDKDIYNNRIVLDQMEYGYLGIMDTLSGLIHFPSQKRETDVILHYDKSFFPGKILVDNANIATAENKYTIDEEFDINEVFRQPLEYVGRKDSVVFYENEIGKSPLYYPKCFNVVSRKGKIELVFGCMGSDSIFFKVSNKKIRYSPHFFLIPK